jgi:esterase/lipase
MKVLFTLIFVIITNLCLSQSVSEYKRFKHFEILTGNDTIKYHIYSQNEIADKTKILLYIQGSAAIPMFDVRKEKKSISVVSTIPFDLNSIPRDYAFIIVSKKCVPFATINETYNPPKCYYENESLDYRVWQYNNVINHITKTVIKNSEKIVALGHSEGSDVVAKLGTVNKKITHIGFWSGSGNTQYNDFALLIRKEITEGKTDEATSLKKLESLYTQIEDIEKNPTSIDKFWLDNTYKRWHEFSEPAVENLLKINIPIFVAIGSKDQAVPLESSLIIKTEFIRHHKDNLTFRIYPDLDHGFETVPNTKNEEPKDRWMDIFSEFMEWANKE